MEYTPKISIIVPVYNVAPYLRQCLDSLVGQTYRNIEIICVNDGATDESGEILAEYAAKDSTIKVISQKNAGLSAARNVGFSFATGDYVMYVDSDDWIDLETCETAVAIAVKHKADIVFWPYIREFQNAQRPKTLFYDDYIVFDEEEFFTQAEELLPVIKYATRRVREAKYLGKKTKLRFLLEHGSPVLFNFAVKLFGKS